MFLLKFQMMLGGVSDPRNRGLMKMFNLIDIGERAGSGIPKIFYIWKDESLKDPVIEEQFDPDRTIITLSLEKRQAIKTSDKISPRAKRTAKNQKKILDYLKDNGRSGCAEIAGYIGLSAARTRAILSRIFCRTIHDRDAGFPSLPVLRQCSKLFIKIRFVHCIISVKMY